LPAAVVVVVVELLPQALTARTRTKSSMPTLVLIARSYVLSRLRALASRQSANSAIAIKRAAGVRAIIGVWRAQWQVTG
jgi:hypothetical protein